MKAKRITTVGVTIVASALVVMSGVMKLSGSEEVVSTLAKVGVGDYRY